MHGARAPAAALAALLALLLGSGAAAAEHREELLHQLDPLVGSAQGIAGEATRFAQALGGLGDDAATVTFQLLGFAHAAAAEGLDAFQAVLDGSRADADAAVAGADARLAACPAGEGLPSLRLPRSTGDLLRPPEAAPLLAKGEAWLADPYASARAESACRAHQVVLEAGLALEGVRPP